jgi:hypothetical protein
MSKFTSLRAVTAAAVIIMGAGAIGAQEMPDGAKLQELIGQIQHKYEPQIAALKAEGEAAAKDAPSQEAALTGIGVRMKRIEVVFHLPDFDGVRQQTWYVRIPEFRMVPQRIVFHVPEPCMIYRPFPWGGGMHVPGVCMREKDWRFDRPEVAWREQRWVVGVPEVSMREHRVIFDVPETVESSKKKFDDVKAKADSIERRAQDLTKAMTAEINGAIRDHLTDMRKQVAAQFDPHVKVLRALIDAAPDEAKADLTRQLADLEKARDEALKGIDGELAKVSGPSTT